MSNTNKRTYFTANDSGEVGCHDCDLATAKSNCEAMRAAHPDDGWEVLDAADAEDSAGPYYVARIRSFYGPSEEMEIVKDDRGFDPEPFDTVEEALEWIDDAEDGVYELSNGEASSPEYLVVDQDVVDWLELDDCGKYDWPEDLDALHDICDNWHDPDDANPDGYACGSCDGCIEWMRARNIEYVRAHAVGIE